MLGKQTDGGGTTTGKDPLGRAVFPECVAKGSRLTWESSLRVELCSPEVVFVFATVRKCSNPAPMALPLGRARKSDFSWMCHDVSVCAAIPL